jgi:5-methylcytosine-specific restriction endonuclease McrA
VHYELRARFEEQALGPRRGRRKRRVRALLARDGDLCWLCGKPLDGDATLDHVVPRSKGGSDALANLKLAHGRCNHRRGNADAAQM